MIQPRSLIFILLFGYFGRSSTSSLPVQYRHRTHPSGSSSPSYLSHPYPHIYHQIDPSGEAHTLTTNENDYETSDDGSVTTMEAAYPPSSMATQNNNHNHYISSPSQSLASSSSYLNNRGFVYDQRNVAAVAPGQLNPDYGYEQQQSHPQQSYVYPEKPPKNFYYNSDDSQLSYQHESLDPSITKDSTVGDLYYKKPTIESEYNSMKLDIDSSSSSSQDNYGYQHGTVTTTEYKTGHYIKPKSTSYKSTPYANAPAMLPKSKTITFTVPQPIPGHKPDHGGGIPSIDVPGLDKLIPNDLLKNSNIKIPSIDFNSILGNLFGGKGDPTISVAAPEGAGSLLAYLVGHGKPLSINAPDIDIFGNSNSDTKTKIVGFSVPDFLKTSSKLIHGLNVPKIDLSGHHETGLTLPHIDLPKTESKGKSPKISAIAPMGTSIHFLRHIPLPSIPKIRLPELGPFKNFRIPKIDLTKIQKKDGLATAEDSLKPTYVTPPISKTIGVIKPTFAHPIAKAITIAKPKKIVTAYPLQKGPLSGHVVIEDYPYGRQQYGPMDDGGEPEIGCAELDKIIHAEPKPIVSNNLYGPKRPLI